MTDQLAYRLALAQEVKENPIRLSPKLYAELLDYFQSMGFDTASKGMGFVPLIEWAGVPVLLN